MNRVILIGILLVVMYSSCTVKNTESLPFKESISSNKSIDSWVKRHLIHYYDSILQGRERVLVLQVYDSTTYFIEFLANESEMYNCSPSYYTTIENKLVLVYDQEYGYYDFSSKELDEEFLKMYRQHVNNDLLTENHKLEDKSIEIEGEEYKLSDDFEVPVHPLVTYNPNILRIEYGFDQMYWSWSDDNFEEYNLNCKFRDLKEYKRYIK